jgi:hypothetical protein
VNEFPSGRLLDGQVPKEYRPLVKAAVRQGWTVSQGRMAHLKLTNPDGLHQVIPSSSRNPVTFRNVRRSLVRMGLEL